jgi:hypothetical protein
VRYEITSPFWDENNRLANLILDGGDPLYGQTAPEVLAPRPRRRYRFDSDS